MIRNTETGEVLVQNRLRKYPGWAFPGGHVERGESVYDCAVREVKEETGLNINNLTYRGVVHWVNRDTDARYLCFMYESTEFDGELITATDEGEQFWMDADELLNAPDNRFSSLHYAKSPLFHEPGKYSEVFIEWNEKDRNSDTCKRFGDNR